MPGRLGSMAARRRPTAASAAGSWRVRAGVLDGSEELETDRVDRLVEKRPDVPAACLLGIEECDPGGSVGSDEVVDERFDGFGVGESEELANVLFIDPVGRGREELVEHRLGIPHATGSELRDEVDGGRVSVATVGGEDAGELSLDLGNGQPPDIEALQARQDRRRKTGRFGRREHEDDEIRRLLERLEQRVPGVLRDLVGFVEDVDLSPQLAGWVRQTLAQVSDGIDAAVAAPRRSRRGRASSPRGWRRTTDSGRTRRRPGGSCN